MNASIITVMLWEREREAEQNLASGYPRHQVPFLARFNEDPAPVNEISTAFARKTPAAGRVADCPPDCSGLGKKSEALS